MFTGIDIFNGTDITSWVALKKAGVKAVYIKATEGRTYQNPSMKEQYDNARSVGMLTGFYHFAGEVSTADQEYDNFANTIRGYVQDLEPCLDYEVDNPKKSWADAFMAKDKHLIFYGSQNVVKMCGYAKNKVWVAMPNTNPKDTGEYAGIQYTWTGKLDGLNGNADIDLFSSNVLKYVCSVLSSQTGSMDPKLALNETIRQLQCNLNLLKIADLVTDGLNGDKTVAALTQFQKIMGITQDGWLGPQSQGAIAAILTRPTDGVKFPHYNYASRYIQWRVNVPIDGTFGPATEFKVKEWQKNNGLVADGIVGNASWSKLL